MFLTNLSISLLDWLYASRFLVISFLPSIIRIDTKSCFLSSLGITSLQSHSMLLLKTAFRNSSNIALYLGICNFVTYCLIDSIKYFFLVCALLFQVFSLVLLFLPWLVFLYLCSSLSFSSSSLFSVIYSLSSCVLYSCSL